MIYFGVFLDQSAGLGYNDTLPRKDLTSKVVSISTRRGRNRLLNSYEAGQAIITFRDDNGQLNPANTSSPYYPLQPMQKIRIVIFNETKSIFTGYISSIKTEFARGQEDYNKVIITCNDLLRYLNQVQISTVTGAGVVEKTGTRIGRLLDMVSYPTGAGYRNIDTGDFNCQADPGTQRNLLDAIRTVQDTENGGFYVGADGEATFVSQTNLGTRTTGTTRFGDTDQTSGILTTQVGFSDVKVNFDDDLLFNTITVTRSGGTAQTASDSASITAYGQRNATRSGTLNTSDSDALYIAKNLRNTLSDSEIRIDEVLFAYHGKSSSAQAKLRDTELYTYREIWKIMADGSTIKKVYVITGIQWEINREQFWVRFLVQEPLVRLFILNNQTLGQLDYNGLSA